MSQLEFDPESFKDLLPIYYRRIFPHKQFYQWLSYYSSEKSIFCNREFSFTLENDIYIRYLSFDSEVDLEKEIINKCPLKIDIGAVMDIRPRHHISSTQIKPVQRELVFDIDLTDYDGVRTCCSEANVCEKCWKFMSVACKIVDTCLREDFGFELILWVFSGRRGIHCWVCDKKARFLNSYGRQCVADYIQLTKVLGENNAFRVKSDNLTPSIKRSLQLIESVFEEIIVQDQKLFETKKGIQKLIDSVPIDNIRHDLASKLEKVQGDSKEVWNTFRYYFQELRGQGNLPRKLKFIVEEVQLSLLYPRLDVNVTVGFNHLLKAPFCVHPKTGKVCVPFNPALAFKFDPKSVPTINVLLDEINEFDKKNNADASDEKGVVKDLKKTSIFKGIFVFEEFLRKMKQNLSADMKMDF